jgi:oligopeptide/dipeptide ABC transporter ATP-binding protein
MEKILEVIDLKTHFRTEKGWLRALDGVSFHIGRGEIFGLAGETGCGKSVTALSILKLIPEPPGFIAGGEILFGGRSILKMTDRSLRSIRGNKISMIFQDPITFLNPGLTIQSQLLEPIMLHQKCKRREAISKVIEILNLVGISDPEMRLKDYPHRLSGGMSQRVMIAMALSCHPDLLIADEPTTALDVTIQAQILHLMKKMREELGIAMLLITHDLGVIAEMCDRLAIMYAGQMVEEGDLFPIFEKPLHPYTRGIISCIPNVDKPVEKLTNIPGTVPSLVEPLSGCSFESRCSERLAICTRSAPPEVVIDENHRVRCFLYRRNKS